MRWLLPSVGVWVVASLVLAAPAAQGDSDPAAQKLFEAMLQKLTTAKAYQFQYDTKAEEGAVEIKFKGTVVAASGNRAKMVFDRTEAKRKVKVVVTSDGKTLAIVTEADGKKDTTSRDVPEKLFEYFTAYTASAGVLIGYEAGTAKGDPPPLGLKTFKSQGKEKVDGKDANKIQYKILSAGAVSFTCTLWIDAQTQLPLKRLVERDGDGKAEYRMTETYSGWELNPKVDDKEFAVPK